MIVVRAWGFESDRSIWIKNSALFSSVLTVSEPNKRPRPGLEPRLPQPRLSFDMWYTHSARWATVLSDPISIFYFYLFFCQAAPGTGIITLIYQDLFTGPYFWSCVSSAARPDLTARIQVQVRPVPASLCYYVHPHQSQVCVAATLPAHLWLILRKVPLYDLLFNCRPARLKSLSHKGSCLISVCVCVCVTPANLISITYLNCAYFKGHN